MMLEQIQKEPVAQESPVQTDSLIPQNYYMEEMDIQPIIV